MDEGKCIGKLWKVLICKIIILWCLTCLSLYYINNYKSIMKSSGSSSKYNTYCSNRSSQVWRSVTVCTQSHGLYIYTRSKQKSVVSCSDVLKILMWEGGLLYFKPGARRPQAVARLVSRNWSCPRRLYVSVCPPPRLLITSGVIWTPYDWLNKF